MALCIHVDVVSTNLCLFMQAPITACSDAVLLLQFVDLVLKVSPIDGEIPAYVYSLRDVSAHSPQLISISAIPILLFATVGLFLVLYMHHSWGVVGTVLAHSQVARHTMRSTMLMLWMLFLWMMVQFYTVTREMKDVVQKDILLALFKDIYTPQVTAGYVQFGSFLAILLLEASFLFVFFFHKSTDLHNRKQQLSKTDCCLCYWIRVLCDTLGAMGMVAAVQMASVYLFYNALNLTVSPIFAIAWVFSLVANIIVSIVYIAMLLEMVSSCCKACSFGRVSKGLAFLLLGLLCLTVNYYVVRQLRVDKHNNYGTFRGLLSSLVSSAVIGLYGYIVKRLLYQKEDADREEREIMETTPLNQR